MALRNVRVLRLVVAAALSLSSYAALAAEPMILTWADLTVAGSEARSPLYGAPSLTNFTFTRLPGMVQPPGSTLKSQQLASGGTRGNLEGANVRISGFAAAIEPDTSGGTEFLLVPYQGECAHVPSHVPPPPANQVVLVTNSEGIALDNPALPVWVTGTLTIVDRDTPYAKAAYQISDAAIEAYEE